MSEKADSTTPVIVADGSDFAMLDATAQAYAEATGAHRAALREELITLAAAVAKRLARRYRDRGEPLDDLEQVALLGLLKAIDGYDPQRGPFGGYLLATVSGELKRHFRDRGWSVRVPRRVQELTFQVTQASARLTAERARRPSTVELAGELRVPEEQVIEALASASAYRPVSLNLPLPGDDGVELADTLGVADAGIERVEDRLTVTELLCRLPERERRMLAMRFYGDHTQSEIAEMLGISQMHASRLLSRALGWLRDALLSEDPTQWNIGHGTPGAQPAPRIVVAADAIVVELAGELERDTADQVRRALYAAIKLGPAATLRVDLRAVPFVDAAAIAVIIGAGEAAARIGMRLALVGARPYVGQALATAGLWPYLEGCRLTAAPGPAAGPRRPQTSSPPARTVGAARSNHVQS